MLMPTINILCDDDNDPLSAFLSFEEAKKQGREIDADISQYETEIGRDLGGDTAVFPIRLADAQLIQGHGLRLILTDAEQLIAPEDAMVKVLDVPGL